MKNLKDEVLRIHPPFNPEFVDKMLQLGKMFNDPKFSWWSKKEDDIVEDQSEEVTSFKK